MQFKNFLNICFVLFRLAASLHDRLLDNDGDDSNGDEGLSFKEEKTESDTQSPHRNLKRSSESPGPLNAKKMTPMSDRHPSEEGIKIYCILPTLLF